MHLHTPKVTAFLMEYEQISHGTVQAQEHVSLVQFEGQESIIALHHYHELWK